MKNILFSMLLIVAINFTGYCSTADLNKNLNLEFVSDVDVGIDDLQTVEKNSVFIEIQTVSSMEELMFLNLESPTKNFYLLENYIVDFSQLGFRNISENEIINQEKTYSKHEKETDSHFYKPFRNARDSLDNTKV